MMSRALRRNDVLNLSKIYEAEFNKPELHDRILVLDVIRDCWQNNEAVNLVCDETNEANQSTEEIKIAHEPPIELEIVTDVKQDETVSPVKEPQEEDTEEHDILFVENESETKSDTRSVSSMADITSESSEQSDDSNHNQVLIKNNTKTRLVSLMPNSSDGEILRQHQFFIHGSWLALQSTYFRSLLFQSGMKESSCKEVHMKITESEENAHLLFLEALYKVDILDGVDVDALLAVLLLAHKYDAKFVFKKCKYCLQAVELSVEICDNIMSFIKMEHTVTDVEDLAVTLQSFLAEKFSPLDTTWQRTSFENLSQPSLKYLLSSDKLMTQTENTVFHALMHWLTHNLDNAPNETDLPSLLSVIRFELMPIDYLYNVVQHHLIATKMPDFNHYYLRGVTYHALTAEMRERLTVKAVPRVATDEKDIVQYTWIILKDELDELFFTDEEETVSTDEDELVYTDEDELLTDKKMKSYPFWCCGYRMQLYLRDVSIKLLPFSYRGSFGLKILRLGNENVVPLEWTLRNSVTMKSRRCEHTFKTEIRNSSLITASFTLRNDTSSNFTGKLGFSGKIFTPPTVVSPSSAGDLHFTFIGNTTPTISEATAEKLPFLSIDLLVELNQ